MKRFSIIVLLATAVLTIAIQSGSLNSDGGGTLQPPALPIPSADKLQHAKLDSMLNGLVQQLVTSSPRSIASRAPIHEGSSIAVTIRATTNVPSIDAYLQSVGAIVANVGSDYLEAYVPVTELVRLSERPNVSFVKAIIPPEPDVTSQGTSVHRSMVWNSKGFSGIGIKVGVIDIGFKGFAGLMGSELPQTVAARCYTAIGSFTSALADCDNDDVHGTGVAEAIFDIAPGLTLYISDPISRGDLQSSVAWMVAEGVQVINMSLAWGWDGPGDGTSPYSDSPLKSVDLAVTEGAVWVNSAGNHANRTWFGIYSDSDTNSWVEFTPGNPVEINRVNLVDGQQFAVELRWEDAWNGANTDLDLYLFDSTVTSVVASSLNAQAGSIGQDPSEYISYTPSVSGEYNLAIRGVSGPVPSWIQLRTISHDLGTASATSSVTNPAESANSGLLAVGAANWATIGSIESFSSRGPTPDGRIKPDIVGADRGDSVSYGSGGFSGTSQASPHVAGLAALVRDRFSGFTPAQVAEYLKTNASPRGTVPNNTWGYGFAQLPSLIPNPPLNVTATDGPGRAIVNWDAPTTDGGSPITSYTVVSTPESKTAVVDGSVNTATVTNLTNGNQYTFTVTATNNVGASAPSTSSSPVTPATTPDAPTGVVATSEASGQATVNWTAPAFSGGAPILSYAVVEKPGGATATTSYTQLSVTLNGLANGVPHTFTVSATNRVGTGATSSPSVTVTPLSVVPLVKAASGLQVEEGTTTAILLATFSDQELSETHSATVNWNDGITSKAKVVETNGSGFVTGTHSFPDDGNYPVTVSVVDSTGQSGSTIAVVSVQNVPPTIKSLTSPFESNDGIQMAPIPFQDQGASDSHSAVIDWGDSVQSSGSINPSFRNIGGIHTYQDPGTYTLAVTVTDDDGGVGSATSSIQIPAPDTLVEIPTLKWWAIIVLSGIFIAALYIWPRPSDGIGTS